VSSNSAEKERPVNIGRFSGWTAVVTFESDKGEPVCARMEIVDSDPSEAARKAVFRASSEISRRNYNSVVIVLTERAAASAKTRAA
jgi:hypothetical protein